MYLVNNVLENQIWAVPLLHTLLFCNFIMSGGWADEAYDEILEFRPDTEDWSLAGHMIEAREGHAVATINFEDVRDVCYD